MKRKMRPVGEIMLRCPIVDNRCGTFRGTPEAAFCPRCMADLIDIEWDVSVRDRELLRAKGFTTESWTATPYSMRAVVLEALWKRVKRAA